MVLLLKDYGIGIILLLFVVFLWTLSNFITQDLYEGGYNKPFLVTYMNTSAFSLYLIPSLLRRFRSGSLQETFRAFRLHSDYQPLATNSELPSESGDSQMTCATSCTGLPPLTEKETASLAFTFCLLWFAANWTVNASLEYTSVASATILTSMSGFLTMGIGRIFRVESLSFFKFIAVCTSFSGVILVSLSDSSTKRLTDLPTTTDARSSERSSQATLGDALALISALFYAVYVILLKVRIKSESRIDMQLFFGFVGLFNILACWPIGLILHIGDIERFELPSGHKALTAILLNMVITLSSDYFYVLSMLKTSPLVVTVGLSLTIPLAVVGDFLRGRSTRFEVLFGAFLVVASFVGVGLENSRGSNEIRSNLDHNT